MTKIVSGKNSIDEPIEKRKLQQTIFEKEKFLIVILAEGEHLRIDLSVLKQEYDIKIGRLYLRIDDLDLDIEIQENGDLLNKGFSFTEAQKLVEETLQKKRERIKEEYHDLNEEVKDFKKHKTASVDEQEELKKLWRKLAHKYHPDLAHGNEEMMKKINKAYFEGDLETLSAIDRELFRENIRTSTIEELKVKLENLIKSIEKANSELDILRKSEWAILKKNIKAAGKQKRDLLNELTEKILADIARKENQCRELKIKYGQRQTT